MHIAPIWNLACLRACCVTGARTLFSAQAVGSIASAWLGGWLVQLLGPRPVLLLAGVFPAGVAATAFMISERRVDSVKRHARQGDCKVAAAVGRSGSFCGS